MISCVARNLRNIHRSFHLSSPLSASNKQRTTASLSHCQIRPCTSFSSDGDDNGDSKGENRQAEGEASVNAAYEGLVAEQQLYPAVPHSGHSVLVLQPKIKWGRNKKTNTTPELQLEEATALIGTLPGWRVVQSFVVPTDYSTKKKRVWKSGKIDELRRLVGQTSATAIMINADMLTATQHRELYDAFHLPVYDRYTTVMLIFKAYAATKEAYLQIQLAEIPYLKYVWRKYFF
uniref:GTPase HflX N-terminal domain-containing protein n=1 Tax=Plectus sambesii TaxID=2011161 RepID=A0A914XRP5_9BILA